MIALGFASAVDLWTTEERCPQVHRRINKKEKLIHDLKERRAWHAATGHRPSDLPPERPPFGSPHGRTERKQADK